MFQINKYAAKLSTTSSCRTERADSYLWNYSPIVNHSVFTLLENWKLPAMHSWYSDAFNIYGKYQNNIQYHGNVTFARNSAGSREGRTHGIHHGWNQDSQELKAGSSQSPEAVFGCQSQRKGGLSILKKISTSGSVATPARVGSLNTQLQCEKKPPEI